MAEENAVKLKDFLERHGARLGEKIEQNLTPVYNPLHPEGVEEYGQKMLTLLRKPFPVQAEVIKGISKALYGRGRRHLFVCGEMGTGKTLVSLATAGNAPDDAGPRRLPHAPGGEVAAGGPKLHSRRPHGRPHGQERHFGPSCVPA